MDLIFWLIILIIIVLALQFIRGLLWEIINRAISKTADKIEHFFKKKD